MTRKTKRLIIIAAVATAVVAIALAFYFMHSKYQQEMAMMQANCQNQINSLQNELDEKKVQVCTPINDIKAGQVISPDMIEEVTIFSDSDPYAFLDQASLVAENTEAVDVLSRYLMGERENTSSEDDELYEEYNDYNSDLEPTGDESDSTGDELESSDEQATSETREEVLTQASAENMTGESTDSLPEDSLTEGNSEELTDTLENSDELLDSTSAVSEEIKELSGVVAVVDLPAGQPIYKNMVQILDCEGLREKFINFVTLNTNLKEGDTVDIRIKFPNGEDYVVLSKDVLRDLNLAGSEFYLWVSEESILRLSAATVDAAINGGEIYVTKYIKPSVQNPLVYTYQPPEDVLRLISWDPNIVLDAENVYSNTKRNEFEARLKAFNSKNSEEGTGNMDVSATTTN